MKNSTVLNVDCQKNATINFAPIQVNMGTLKDPMRRRTKELNKPMFKPNTTPKNFSNNFVLSSKT